MKYLLLASLGCFAASALAADCSNPAGPIPSELLHVYWDARNKMCSNSDCAQGKNCVVSAAATSNNKELVVVLSRTKSSGSGFPYCYVRVLQQYEIFPSNLANIYFRMVQSKSLTVAVCPV